MVEEKTCLGMLMLVLTRNSSVYWQASVLMNVWQTVGWKGLPRLVLWAQLPQLREDDPSQSWWHTALPRAVCSLPGSQWCCPHILCQERQKQWTAQPTLAASPTASQGCSQRSPMVSQHSVHASPASWEYLGLLVTEKMSQSFKSDKDILLQYHS